MIIYEVIFGNNEHKIFNDEKSALSFCKQFYITNDKYIYEYDRYIIETSNLNGGCCLIKKEVLL